MNSKKYDPAVKAFIVDNNQLFIIKRSDKDVHKPGVWEIPGGRLNKGENPIKGLIRETKEETNLDIEVIKPINIKHFTRDDGQNIEMTVYFCKVLTKNVILSSEHTAFEWINVDNAKERLNEFFHGDIDNFKKMN